ncbi:hypothetical protein QPK87_27550 [Kamptonema cortianum]|nr:hypothetical protein [Oscillatoria laete-virens]MDK3160286.1 hypothetical protein [Kamptonema cortianum]MDL5053670.1 hypothetical protein [Oscillatoria laete-virens NRMC-F 0139]
MVVASILIHIGILVGLGSLVYVFTVQYPESVGKREKARKEAEWLQSAVEEIKNSDGTTESLIRIKLPDSILHEATNAITAPTLSLPPQTNDLSRATASP